jgi:hypothetical protein
MVRTLQISPGPDVVSRKLRATPRTNPWLEAGLEYEFNSSFRFLARYILYPVQIPTLRGLVSETDASISGIESAELCEM